MKLSEAIRIGAMALPAAKGPVITYRDGKPCGACLIGTALHAVGWPDAEQRSSFQLFPVLEVMVDPPIDDMWWQPVYDACIELFEERDWTREQIAEWVESIERSLELQSPAAGEAQVNASDSLVSDAEVLIHVHK